MLVYFGVYEEWLGKVNVYIVFYVFVLLLYGLEVVMSDDEMCMCYDCDVEVVFCLVCYFL